MSAQDKFEAIYRERVWANASPTLFSASSLSGHGSTEYSTRVFRAELTEFIRKERLSSLFDAPCGDFHWMSKVAFPEGFKYIGGDIVASVIERLKLERQSPAQLFVHFDLTRDAFPQTDAWLCKDCLQHLSYADVFKVLKNFAQANVAWALVSNHTGVDVNTDIETGGFRYLDLTKPPFNLPPPRLILRDQSVDREPRGVFVWRREDIRLAAPALPR